LLLWRQPAASDGFLKSLLLACRGFGVGFEMGTALDIGWRSEVRDDVLPQHPKLIGDTTEEAFRHGVIRNKPVAQLHDEDRVRV
jgi:hypothetical protein